MQICNLETEKFLKKKEANLPFIQIGYVVPHFCPFFGQLVGIFLPALLIGRYHPGSKTLSHICPPFILPTDLSH